MDLKEINSRITDRTDCFYWQTDRRISVEEAALIWKDRHSAITNKELLKKINNELKENKLLYIEEFDINAQTSLGNVNSVRVGVLENGKEVIIRCHPKGVKNGYFHVESLASRIAKLNGIPAYDTLLIHDLNSEDDIAFQVIEKLEGDTIQFYLKKNPNEDKRMAFEMGKLMAKLHQIKVNGFGPFINEENHQEKLVGEFKTLQEAVNAGLDENLERLVKYNIVTDIMAKRMKKLFENNPLLSSDESVLIHNDFADWNLLTDGNNITGVIDWDECVAGNPIQEIACWSNFFELERLKEFLEGYFSISKKLDNFEESFQLFKLRYTISKMALRVKRYTYEKTTFLENLINNGRKHLVDSIDFFFTK